jgi:hypothetical protein
MSPQSKEEGGPASAVTSAPETRRNSSAASDTDVSHDGISIHDAARAAERAAVEAELDRCATHQVRINMSPLIMAMCV